MSKQKTEEFDPHAMFQGYLVQPDYVIERKGDYALRDMITAAWEPCEYDGGSCGNVAMELGFNVKTRKAKFGIYPDYKNFVPMFQAIPSALLLYRLGCMFSFTVTFADNYKSVWEAPFKHKATGVVIVFGEHKGGAEFFASYGSHKQMPPQAKKDLLALLNYLMSDKCAHPYDRVTAGSVA